MKQSVIWLATIIGFVVNCIITLVPFLQVTGTVL